MSQEESTLSSEFTNDRELLGSDIYPYDRIDICWRNGTETHGALYLEAAQGRPGPDHPDGIRHFVEIMGEERILEWSEVVTVRRSKV